MRQDFKLSKLYRVTEWTVCKWVTSKLTYWYIRDVCSIASRAKGYQALPLLTVHRRCAGESLGTRLPPDLPRRNFPAHKCCPTRKKSCMKPWVCPNPLETPLATGLIFNVERYVGWGYILNCSMLSSLPCFYAFCWSAIPTSCYISSLSLAAVLAEEYHWPDQAFFIYSPLTKSISNSAILRNN